MAGIHLQSGGDAAVQALDWKAAVETVSDTNITLSGEQTLNGLLTSTSRVGVVGQTDKTENGIYVSAAGAWTRAIDADTDDKVTNGLAFSVADSGSDLASNIYLLVEPDPITLGVTDLVFDELQSFLNATVGDLVTNKVGAPGASDDNTVGHIVGDHIRDTSTGIIYAAEDVSTGAAVWRKITTHTLGGAEHAADTLANLNAKVSDATLVNSAAAPFTVDLTGDGKVIIGQIGGTPGTDEAQFSYSANIFRISNPNTDGAAQILMAPRSGLDRLKLTVNRLDPVGTVGLGDSASAWNGLFLNKLLDITLAADGVGQIIKANASQTADLVQLQDSAGAIGSRFNKDEFFMTRKNAAPADGDLANSEASLWVDDTVGSAGLRVKGKDSAGTVFTQAVDIQEDVLTWVLNEGLNVDTVQDSPRAVRKSGTITGVIISAKEKGGAGTALFDIHKHVPTKPITTQRDNTSGTTIYTTQANRPSIVGGAASTENMIKQAAAPDVTTFAAGDFFTLDVDADPGGAKSVTIQMFVRYNAT